ncbi:hypothetical protein MKX01_032003 [Papaver californicum]|nr:hypothetical protein MKX01_032003 [Papaver californicum]
MIPFCRSKFLYLCFSQTLVNQLPIKFSSHCLYPTSKTITNYASRYLVPGANYSVFACLVSSLKDTRLKNSNLFTQNPIPPNVYSVSKYSECSICSLYLLPQRILSTKVSQCNRKHKKSKCADGSSLTATQIEQIVSELPPRFDSEDLCRTITLQKDPRACLELFNYASQQPRFRHDASTYHITIKKLGSAKLYDEMASVASQVLAFPAIGSEDLFNTIIYLYIVNKKISRAVDVYNHMRKSSDPTHKPSIRTYNLLFTVFLSKRRNSYLNHMNMENIICLFKQMVGDGIEPDIFSLNAMIKGYVLSLHINDALRIFHQMGVTFQCRPDSKSYDYLIHGLCCQGRTKNAKELYQEMMDKRFVPDGKAYNSLANSLAIVGETEEAVRILWEMNEKRRTTKFITYRTILDEICRQGKVREAMRLLKEIQEKDLVNEHTHRKLLHVLEGDAEDSND